MYLSKLGNSWLHRVHLNYLCGKEKWRKRHKKCTSDKSAMRFGRRQHSTTSKRCIDRVDKLIRVNVVWGVPVSGYGANRMNNWTSLEHERHCGGSSDFDSFRFNHASSSNALLLLAVFFFLSFTLTSLGFNIASAFKLFCVRVMHNSTHIHTRHTYKLPLPHRHARRMQNIWHSFFLFFVDRAVLVYVKWRMYAH